MDSALKTTELLKGTTWMNLNFYTILNEKKTVVKGLIHL